MINDVIIIIIIIIQVVCETESSASYCQGHVTFLVRSQAPICSRLPFTEQDTFFWKKLDVDLI
jgi:hypothetical protein